MDFIQPPKKKKKVDYEALNSPFMKIPGMRVEGARALIDLGFRDIFELSGRCPDNLFEELSNKRDTTPKDYRAFLRLAVYYAETPEPDATLLRAGAWL